MKPSMSKAGELLACQWWAAESVQAERRSAGEPAEYGIVFHACMADGLTRGSISPDLGGAFKAEVIPHAQEALTVLGKWLGGTNPFDVDFSTRTRHVERSIAYAVLEDKARGCLPPREEDHVYPDATADELPGTADLIVLPPGKGKLKSTLLVLDHKTGAEIDLPGESAQLKALALAASRLYGFGAAVVAILHAPREGVPVVYSDELNTQDLLAFRSELRLAWSKIGDGTMRPGGQCKWCPALTVCPTSSSLLVDLRASKTLQVSTAEEIGAIHMELSRYEALAKQLKEEMKDWVVKNGPAIRPDGKWVDLVEKSKENLSKASIERGVGKVAAVKIIEDLRKKKCIDKSTWLELRAGKD
jgi:hypothetical protein